MRQLRRSLQQAEKRQWIAHDAIGGSAHSIRSASTIVGTTTSVTTPPSFT
jgi:hypothetical protein